jgi:hypothetical protein
VAKECGLLRAPQICQLQVSLYNKGVFEALAQTQSLDEREYHSRELFPTLATSPATWAPSSFVQDTVLDYWYFAGRNESLSPPKAKNLLVLKSRFERAELERFVKSQAWGPQRVNVSRIADLEWFFEEGGIHMDDFINW